MVRKSKHLQSPHLHKSKLKKTSKQMRTLQMSSSKKRILKRHKTWKTLLPQWARAHHPSPSRRLRNPSSKMRPVKVAKPMPAMVKVKLSTMMKLVLATMRMRALTGRNR